MSAKSDIPGLDDLRLGSRSLAIVKVLDRARPRYVHIDALIDMVYADDPDGGPNDPKATIAVLISILRKRMKAIGWTISTNGRGRGIAGRYKLEPVKA